MGKKDPRIDTYIAKSADFESSSPAYSRGLSGGGGNHQMGRAFFYVPRHSV